MPHIQYSSPEHHDWAQPGEWDWTVKACLIGSLLLGGSMLLPELHLGRNSAEVVKSPAQAPTCVPDVGEIYRMIGHSAWDVLQACEAGDHRESPQPSP
ncbi:hypothetical protein [Zoogloea sp.]|uniref:hypothetical protein n=1 Tax=Zoogloea sp. TaxID=49181 RepID=UPI00141677A4|nr:MAG: hypothetical protein F9K15_19740 [Zoogloea sp.]